jgi:D-2-hydroxyacid dehydrogenase (NADP+)
MATVPQASFSTDQGPRPLCILVSAAVAASDGPGLVAACAQAGVEAQLLLHDRQRPLSPAELERIDCALLSVDVIGDSSKSRIDPELATFSDTLRAAPHLRWLQVCSAGMDRPLYGELRRRGVRLSSGAGTNAKAVAQTALAGVLALARGLPHWVAAQRDHRWAPLRGAITPVALEGQRAVVIGMGGIGCDIARLLSAFDLRVTGVRRTPAPAPHFESVVGLDDIDSVLPQADWLVLACPLTEETRGLVDARRLALMKPGSRLVNIARGEIVDETALAEALRSGALAGAYLDVFAVEPLPESSPLWDMPNLLVSPHSAGNSTHHQRNVIALFRDNLHRLATGQALVNEWLP